MSGSGLIPRCPARYLERYEDEQARPAPVDLSSDRALDRAMAEAYPGYQPDYAARYADLEDEGEFSLEDLLP